MKENLKRQGYVAPMAEVIEIENQGVLCASAGSGSKGGTESMNMTDVNWP